MGLAAQRVAHSLPEKSQKKIHCLVDGNVEMISTLSQQTIVKGDSKVMAIAAASILAKEQRDSLMDLLENKYPGYELSSHKGYPTKKHKALISEIGPSPVHRRTFSGVKEYLS